MAGDFSMVSHQLHGESPDFLLVTRLPMILPDFSDKDRCSQGLFPDKKTHVWHVEVKQWWNSPGYPCPALFEEALRWISALEITWGSTTAGQGAESTEGRISGVLEWQ